MNWFMKRISEPSTWGALAAIVGGTGVIGKINEAEPIAEALGNAGAAVASGVDPMTAAIVGALGALGVIMKDKGN